MSEQVAILNGNTFVVSDRTGNIDASPSEAQGLFDDDTRFLSRWILTVNGTRPGTLSVDEVDSFAKQFFLAPTASTVYVNSTIAIVRTRSVEGGFREQLGIFNNGPQPAELAIRIEADADFADLFEVKDALAKEGDLYRRVDGGALVLGYRRECYIRETRVSASAPEARFDAHGVTFQVRIPPGGSWTATITVTTVGIRQLLRQRRESPEATAAARRDGLQKWLDDAPKLSSSWNELPRIYRRSLIDLDALRFNPVVVPGTLPAAGLPWFMAVFGRDSLLTSFQALPFAPELAKTTLQTLALFQGSQVDAFRDEEPGKIMHELRIGELTAFEDRPHSPYYGSADATPLYLVLLDEYEQWTGDAELVAQLECEARLALEWIDRWGDRDGDGYVEYATRNPSTGLENQCWKDSWDSIRFADGEFAPLPRATCEIQGYVYDAKTRAARLARRIWRDPGLAERLEREAAALRRRFNEDFWLEDRGYFALALDGNKRKVDSLTSNIGHLLWSGIVDKEKAARVADQLVGERLFSGWGVRTMAQGENAYNPIGYHVGTVWPHDSAFVALGLRRYGYHEAAARIARGLLEAAVFFDARLPEAFAGFAHSITRCPVEYPTACSPQAWAAGTPLLLLRVLLGLRPVGDDLLVAPAIPESIERIELLGIQGRWGRSDAFGRGRIEIEGR